MYEIKFTRIRNGRTPYLFIIYVFFQNKIAGVTDAK